MIFIFDYTCYLKKGKILKKYLMIFSIISNFSILKTINFKITHFKIQLKLNVNSFAAKINIKIINYK